MKIIVEHKQDKTTCIAQVSANFSFHKTKASIPQIIAAFAAEA